MADSTVNIVHELTFVTNEASVAKVDQTIATLTRTLQALNMNAKQVGTNLNTIITNLNNSSKAANDYANSMKRAAEATNKFGQVSQNMGNLTNAAAAKMTAGFDRANAQFKSLQQTMLVAMTASTKRMQGLSAESQAIRNTADEVKKLQQAYAAVKGVQPRTATAPGGGGVVSPDDDAQRVFGVKLSAIQRRFVTGYIVGAGFSAFNATINTIKDFLSESSQFAAQMDNISKAFERIADPGLIQRLREATGGTVSDLDLMQRSVNAVNLGLPVQKLADAFEFARIRARETGQSVDYLVNSVVLGIGRKSPLILDNLGISALRVRDRFKQTGDFAEAAFQIINEELQKSGQYVDQYTDRMDRLTATIKNQQVAFGGYINIFKDYTRAAALDLTTIEGFIMSTDLFGSAAGLHPSNVAALGVAREAAAKDAELAAQAQIEADKHYLNFYGDYQKKLKDADFLTRSQIVEQAKGKYEQLLKMSGEYAKKTGMNEQVAARMFQQMQQRFTRDLPDASLKNLEVSKIKFATKDVLEDILKQVEQDKTPLTSGDTQLIEKYSAIRKEAQRNLDLINEKERRTRRDRVDPSIELDLSKRIASLQAQIDEARVKDDALTTEKIEEHANTRIRKYEEELDAIEKDAKRRGALTETSKKMISQLRIMVRELNAVIAGNDSRELFDKRLLDLHKAYEERVQAGRKLLGTREGQGAVATVEQLRSQIEAERSAAKNAEEDRHKAQIKALRANNEATEHEEAAHLLRMEDIRLDYNQRTFDAIKDYYDQIRKEAAKQFSAEASDIQDIISGRQEALNARPTTAFFGRKGRQRMLDLRANVDTTALASREAEAGYTTAKQELGRVQEEIIGVEDLTQQQTLLQNAINGVSAARKRAADAGKEQKAAEDDLTQALKEQILGALYVYDELASAAVNAYNQIAQAQEQQLNREIQIREERLRMAERFAERGNTEYLRLEQERLDRSLKQQAKSANQQIAINTALAASQAAVGVIQAAVAGDPYTAVARVIAFLAAVSAGVIQATNAANAAQPSVQFYKGGYTGDGGKYEEAGTVHKGEFVSNQETTRRHRRVLESMHDGTFDDKYARVDEKALRVESGRQTKDKDTLNKLDEVIEAVEGQQMSVRQSLDKNGLLQVVDRTRKIDRQRFS